MEVWEVFNQGLTITGVGMGLVFLTLIIIAALIWLLSKVFPGQVQVESEEEAAEEEDLAGEATRTAPVATVSDDGANVAAAVAVVLALQAEQARPALATAAAGGVTQMVAALPWQGLTHVDDEEITGEVIQVAGMTGSANWKARGRLDGLK